MGRKKFINTILNTVGLHLQKVPVSFNNSLANYGIPKKEYVKSEANLIYLKKLGINIKTDPSNPVIQSYGLAVDIINKCGGEFYVNDEIRLKVNDMVFCINDKEELFIINEVFCEKCYNLILPRQEKKISFIDIGMNVGISSIFFASNENVTKVYSFEPFPITYNMGLKNISLNPKIADKIIPHNYGLSNKNYETEVEYSLESKGRMSIWGTPLAGEIGKSIKQKIKLFDINPVFKKIREENIDSILICKMDCEGSEFDLIEAVKIGKTLHFISVFLIEWHFKDPQIIVDTLVADGFSVIQTIFPQNNSGLIYAFMQKM